MAETGKIGAPQGPIHRAIPEGDNRERLLCRDCGFVHYQNPKIVVGAIVTWREEFLLCRRAIEPRRGYLDDAGGLSRIE